MAEQNPDNEKTISTKRSKKRLWIIFIFFFALILNLLFWRFFFYQSVDEQLAAIEASRTIPDSENAAFYYRQFFNKPNNISALEDLSSYTPSATREPWHDSEFPELATLLKTNQQLLQTLVDISQMQEARFQIYPDPMSDSNSMSALIRRATFILSWAAANDLAEGRIDEALSKIRCQIHLACHLEQHPVSIYRLVGIAIEAVGLHNIRVAVMRGELTQEQLNSLASIVAIPKSYTEPDPQLVEKLDRLVGTKQRSTLSLIARLHVWWQERRSYESTIEKQYLIHTRSLSGRRGTEILITLRRFKNEAGHWPESLDEIKPMVAENTLIDPTNNSSYVYKLTNDCFVLYSKGENNIDEGGRYKAGTRADDRTIWP